MSIELRQEVNALMVGMRESQLAELLRVAREIADHPEKFTTKPEDTL